MGAAVSWRRVREWRGVMRDSLDVLPRTMQHPATLRAAVDIALDALTYQTLEKFEQRQVRPYDTAALVLARTVPTACIEWCALLMGWGSRVTLKPPTATPHLAQWLVTTAHEAGLPLRSTHDRDALAKADVVIAMGRDETIRDIGKPLPNTTRYVGLGDRFSVAWVDGDTPWERLAQDIVLHDTRGCMSPTAIFTPLPLRPACEALQQALDCAAQTLPSGEVMPFEAAAIRARRQLAEATTGVALASEHGEVHGLRITLQPPAALPRCVAVYHVSTPQAMADALASSSERLSTVGAPKASHAFFEAAFPRVRVCDVGDMQRPPLQRLHDGLDWIAQTHR